MRRPAQTISPRWWSRTHPFVLVAGVLLVHLWLLGGSARWFSPTAPQTTTVKVLTTRHVEVETPTPRARQKPTPVAATLAPTTPAQSPALASEPVHARPPVVTHAWASAQELEDLHAQLTAPVALPARSAEAVDLPPFNRGASDASGQTQMTAFKAPNSARLQYDVKGQARFIGYSAWADLRWQQDGQHYEARLEVGAFLLGSRVQTSTGLLGAEGLMPLRFGDKSRSELAAHFQRDKNIISFSANTPDVPLLKGAQDRLSVVLQLGALLGAEPDRFPPGTMLSFQTVSQREAEMWQFVVEKEELLRLPYGELHTIKLNRNPRREFDQRIELWLAPSLGFLPARLRITNANGDFVDQLLRTVETPGS